MKTILPLVTVLVILLSVSCSKRDDQELSTASGKLVQKQQLLQVPAGIPLEKEKLDLFVMSSLESGGIFDWEETDLHTRWSALQYGDHSLAIGYKPASDGDISGKLHQIDLSAGPYKEVHDALLRFIVEELNRHSSDPVLLDDILIEDDPVLPVITVRTTDKHLLTALANLENIRYLEPLGFWPGPLNRSTTGCTSSTVPLDPADFSGIAPGSILPWNFDIHNVTTAWNTAQGLGITVGVIDAGLSNNQPLLGGQFNNGDSNVGRLLTTDFTYGNSVYSTCSHGNAMSGLAVGPRNNQNSTCGVAYKSNLHFIRGAEDVVLDLSSEKTATKNAFVRMGKRRDVRIISLSMGTPFSSSVLKDGVDYAYNMGKLIFAAAGTSLTWTTWYGVVYPAFYSSCIAVTGVKENGSRCASCHEGSKVLYTVTMERNVDSNRNTLGYNVSGTTPSYIGGSSSATATAAGIAALVWSVRPNMTRAQLLTCLTNTSQLFPNKSSNKGFGNLNASAAVNYAVTYF